MNNDLVNWIKLVKETNSLKFIYDKLIEKGYTKENMVCELKEVYGIEEIEKIFNLSVSLVAIPYPDVKLNNSNTIIIDGRVCRVLFELKLPRVIMIDNFLSTMECQQIISMAEPKIDRSLVVDKDSNGESKLDSIRTSSGMFFSKQENDLISEIENRIAMFTNWPVSNQEGLQILNYKPGQEYKPHNDYFDTTTEAGRVITKRGGQRVGTVILYLNSCPEGGGTIFPESGLELKPAKGCAVFFGYPTHNKESKTLHGGSPVISGEKWIAVKWLRQNEFI